MSESEELKSVRADLERKQQEIQELREEMNKMKNEASRTKFAFGFDIEEFKKKSFINASRFASDTRKVAMIERMLTSNKFFEPFKLMKGCRTVNAKTCGRFNQGTVCYDQWHVNQKKEKGR